MAPGLRYLMGTERPASGPDLQGYPPDQRGRDPRGPNQSNRRGSLRDQCRGLQSLGGVTELLGGRWGVRLLRSDIVLRGRLIFHQLDGVGAQQVIVDKDLGLHT